jgi:hypothetical protein
MGPRWLVLLLLLVAAGVLAQPQCFSAAVTLTSSASLPSPCVGPSCPAQVTVMMDLTALQVYGMGLTFNQSSLVCLNELVSGPSMTLQCTALPAGGGQTSVTIVATEVFSGGSYFVLWQYAAVNLTCASFNGTLAPVGAVFKQLQVQVQMPTFGTFAAQYLLNPAYSLAAMLQPNCTLAPQLCIVPEQKCYASPSLVGLVSGTQPGSGACSQAPANECLLEWQFALVPSINPTTKALTQLVAFLQVTFTEEYGYGDYCLSSFQNISTPAFGCSTFVDLNTNATKMQLALLTPTFTLQWIYALFNTSGLTCQLALFDPRFITAQPGYVFGTDLLYLVNLALLAGPTQWLEADPMTCTPEPPQAICHTNGDCLANQTCTSRLDELQLLQVACPLAVPPCAASATASITRTPSFSSTASNTPTPSNTPSNTGTPSNTASVTSAASGSATPTTTRTPTGTPTASRTASQTPSNPATPSQTPTSSRTSTQTPTQTGTAQPTRSSTSTISLTASPSPTIGTKPGGPTVPAAYRTATIVLAAVLGTCLLLCFLALLAGCTWWRQQRAVAATADVLMSAPLADDHARRRLLDADDAVVL